MNEHVRQHYLTQMGVTLWYSRCELPGAAASPEFDFGDEVSVAVPGVSGSGDAELPATGNNSVAKVQSAADILNAFTTGGLAGAGPANKKPSTPVTASLSQHTLASNQEERQVRSGNVVAIDERTPDLSPLQYEPISPPEMVVAPSDAATSNLDSLEALELKLWVGERFWILSDNDAEFPDSLKQQLLLNISRALGEKVSDHMSSLHFSWPFFANRRLPGNDSASMRQLLLEWLAQYIDSDRLQGILMGARLTKALLQITLDEAAGKNLDLNLSDERGIKVVPTLSLNDLLRESSNKKITWQHLSSYRIK